MPVPVSSVTALMRFAELGVARNVATPVPRPDTPVEIGNPEQLESVPALGVPKLGVTKAGEVAKTKAPDPVSSLMTPLSSKDVVAAKNAKVFVAVGIALPPFVTEAARSNVGVLFAVSVPNVV